MRNDRIRGFSSIKRPLAGAASGALPGENRYPVVALVPRLHTGDWLKRLRRKEAGLSAPNFKERVRAVDLGQFCDVEFILLAFWGGKDEDGTDAL